MKKVKLTYYALLREMIGKSQEEHLTNSSTLIELYTELQEKYDIHYSAKHLKVAVNNEFSNLDKEFTENDHIVFIPPVAGG